MELRFTTSAKAQFLGALRFIAEDNPSAAASFRIKAEETLQRLKDFPDSGRVLPEFPDLPYRELIVPPYRFFYRVEDEGAVVVGVWHTAQIPSDPKVLRTGQ